MHATAAPATGNDARSHPPSNGRANGANHGQPRGQHPSSSHKPHRHRPSTQHDEPFVYPLTLSLSPSLHDSLNTLRSHYFPRHRLKVPAHLTLFHALPHSELDRLVIPTLEKAASETRSWEVKTGEVFKLGNQGVAVAPAKGESTDEGAKLHARLRREWEGFLSKQDAKGFKAHWTVQNKVQPGDDGKESEKVAQCFEEVSKWTKEEGAVGRAEGVVLWRYEKDGTWTLVKEFQFVGGGHGK
ncbi:hypothetical protein JCM11251_004649 [Rhodosporidiobolus azoricus]